MPLHHYDVDRNDDDDYDCGGERVYTGLDTADVVIASYVLIDIAKHKSNCKFEIPRPEIYR